MEPNKTFASYDGNIVVSTALKYLGTPYLYGGETPQEGFDSSGFVQYVFKEAVNIQLPRTISEQWKMGDSISKSNLQSGDIVFFKDNSTGKVNHAAIYAENDQIIHPTTSQGIAITGLTSSTYWNARYAGAKRITGEPAIDLSNPIVAEAVKHEGITYLYGGENPQEGFDSSGFVQYVFKKAVDIQLPRTVSDQWKMGESISKSNLEPGDVAFFKDSSTGKINHVAIYGGNDQIIHPTASQGVAITGLTSSTYWNARYVGAKRITGEPPIDLSNPIVAEAVKHEGITYLYGGETPQEGFDSSGFVQYVFKKAVDIQLPRTVSAQWKMGDSISKSNLESGDVVFFKDNSTGKVNHVAIYAGNDQIIHPTTSQGVAITGLTSSTYWNARYAGAKRITSEPAIDLSNPIVAEAIKHEGVAYLYGGDHPQEGFDSSGFAQYVFNKAVDIQLPRNLSDQWKMGESIAMSNLEPGDLVFFKDSSTGKISHVAIYAGNDRIIHPTTSQGVAITGLTSSTYWNARYAGAKRITSEPPIDLSNPIVAEAHKYLGIPYDFGEESPEIGFDCSGLVQYVFKKVKNINLPRTTIKQWETGTPVAKPELQPGDVVFFSNTYREGISHVGIYIGENRFIHAQNPEGVIITYLSDSYYSGKYTGARRY